MADKDNDFLYEGFDSTMKLEPVGDKEKKNIPRICPWCNKIFCIEEWDIETDRKTGASHGMCSKCFDKHKEQFSQG